MCRLLGEYEAREGRTLDSLQAAYRIGCQIAWQRMTKVVLRAKLPAAVMGALADALFSYVNELAAISAEGYRNEQRRSGQARQQHRARLLRMVLEPGVSREALEEVAEHADWPLPPTATMAALRPGMKRDDAGPGAAAMPPPARPHPRAGPRITGIGPGRRAGRIPHRDRAERAA
jgi:hypothetical protein